MRRGDYPRDLSPADPSGASNERGNHMADRVEYIEACKEAKDALYDVLMMIEPDTGQQLRLAYSELKGKLREHEAEDPEVVQQKAEKKRLERERGKTRGTRYLMEERDAYVLEHLAEERLTIGELSKRMKAAMHVEFWICESYVRSHVGRMFKAGKLHREGEQWHSRVRYRYYHPRELEGHIADLQKQFENGEDR